MHENFKAAFLQLFLGTLETVRTKRTRRDKGDGVAFLQLFRLVQMTRHAILLPPLGRLKRREAEPERREISTKRMREPSARGHPDDPADNTRPPSGTAKIPSATCASCV